MAGVERVPCIGEQSVGHVQFRFFDHGAGCFAFSIAPALAEHGAPPLFSGFVDASTADELRALAVLIDDLQDRGEAP